LTFYLDYLFCLLAFGLFMTGFLIFKDGTVVEGTSFGAAKSTAGEIVFSTGMVGYPESLTDPSYQGQILVMTYPIIGNYGVPNRRYWESEKIRLSGLIVSTYNDTPSHYLSERQLSNWLKDENIPALIIKDTRYLTQKLRDEGSSLGKIVIDKDVPFYDPNKDNLVAQVSTKQISFFESEAGKTKSSKTILYIDCGGKRSMITCLQKRGADVIVAPWDFDPFAENHRGANGHYLPKRKLTFAGVVISNGPGDPKLADKTIETIKKILSAKIPLLGICLGHQLLCLAAGGNTEKLKFGHRSQNGPCLLANSSRCYITTHNHGFTVSEIPKGFRTWFTNANDGSNEGIIHTKLPFMSVQFHPEATPGPQDAEWIFDYFLERVRT
jgi:carbamoyl-phosphate synthase small subunit